ncbi:hypothetical protein [Prevotella sp.]
MAFAELVTPVPRKTIVFRINLLTFANRKKSPPIAPPNLPERGGGKFASILQKLSEKRVKKSLSSYVRIGTPPPSGRLGGASSPPPNGEGSE